jgi:hypothetical protein
METDNFSTGDEFAVIDEEFENAHHEVLACVCNPKSAITPSVEDASDLMFDIAIQLGDKTMLAFCFGRFNDFITQGRPPPRAMLEHINDAFTRFRSGVPIDAAFGLKHSKRKRPPSWKKRLEDRTAASVIAHFVIKKGSETAGREEAEDVLKRPDLRRIWKKYRRIKKA